MLTIYLLTWSGIILAQLAPGPNLVAIASAAMAHGRRTAYFIVFGIAVGTFIWSVAAATGLGVLIKAFPSSMTLLKLLGGGFLMYLGLRAMRKVLRGTTDLPIAKGTGHLSHRRAWVRGFIVVITNPETALMWVSVDAYLSEHKLNSLHTLAFGPLSVLSGVIIYWTFAYLFSTGVATEGYKRFSLWFEIAFALAFFALGLSFLLSLFVAAK
ncbi:MAG: LysE family translocator [Pseudomonadota bacterium]